MRLALFTAMYPGIEQWLPDWAASVAAQTDTDFDLCVALDGLTAEEVRNVWNSELDARWYPAPEGASPAAVRNHALLKMVSDYDGVVLVDADDYLLPTRIEAAKRALTEADVSCCALEIVDINAVPVGKVFDPSPGPESLPTVNVYGFGNSVYSSRVLAELLPIHDQCELMDWQLACRARIAGFSMHVDIEPRMLYRQYEANTARVLPPFTGEQVLRGTELVLNHYDLLAESFPEGFSGDFAVAMQNARFFADIVKRDPAVLETYVEALNALNTPHVWWSFVAHPQLEMIWNC